MEYTIINAFLYIIGFRFIWKKKKTFDYGMILIMLYTLVACTCVVTYHLNIQRFELMLWPFIYIFICFLLIAKPLLFKEYQVSNFEAKNIKLCYTFVFVMFIAALINMYYSMTSTVALVTNDEVLEMYQDKDKMATSVNTIDWFCKNLLSYFSIPFSIVFFYFLTKPKKKKYVLLLLSVFAVIFFSNFLTSAMRALRWNILHDVACLISGYLLFYKKIPYNNKKLINLIILIGGLLALSFFIFVTISRHSISGSNYGGDSTSAFIFYLGHSMMTFNYGVVDTIHSFANGNFFLGKSIGNLGIHTKGDFPTFVGNMYIDFGFIFTILLCFLIGYFFSKKKRITSIADAFLISFYFVFIFMGAFTHSSGYGISILICLITYILLKLFF